MDARELVACAIERGWIETRSRFATYPYGAVIRVDGHPESETNYWVLTWDRQGKAWWVCGNEPQRSFMPASHSGPARDVSDAVNRFEDWCRDRGMMP